MGPDRRHNAGNHEGALEQACESLVTANETRRRYVAALRAADNHDFGPLLDFVRS